MELLEFWWNSGIKEECNTRTLIQKAPTHTHVINNQHNTNPPTPPTHYAYVGVVIEKH